jgi:hypothetical protein
LTPIVQEFELPHRRNAPRRADRFHSDAVFLYLFPMTKLLDKALEAVRRLPSDDQDEIARAMLRLAAGDDEPEPVDPAHLPAVLQGLAEAKRRQFATDEEVEAAFRRFDR